ncbi:Hypothetical protein CINCED_3A003599 [Cinara cedri]|uniref:Uncharacterized protein n=1 Tax=Cinara cedri TaxID=506608 RepID=A0A5E4MJ45_9HEMI|nr:Hypothetical protein CINCED_3A003599 [Cinara cedri]
MDHFSVWEVRKWMKILLDYTILGIRQNYLYTTSARLKHIRIVQVYTTAVEKTNIYVSIIFYLIMCLDGDSSTSVPLSHSAAKHRIAIRPKRKHGNPRSKNPLTVTNALPATPEVNEEHSGLSTSPETNKPLQTAADSTTDGTTTTTTNTSTTTITTITVTSTNTTATTTTTSAALVTVTCPIDGDGDGDGATTVGSCDLDTSVDEISVENVPRREEGFFHRLLSRRSTKKKAATTKCSSAEDVDVDTFLFDETMGPKPRQREEPPPAGRMQLSYPPDLPPDRQPPHPRDATTVAENIFGSADTFVPIKRSFSIGQQMVGGGDDDLTSCSGGGESSSVQKSSSSDSVSSTALDDSIASVVVEPATVVAGDERRRSYSSSDSDHLVNGGEGGGGGGGGVNLYQHQHHQNYHQRPVPAPRPSKLFNGGGGPTDVVIRRKKRDDLQQPELFKVFARRSLKLGKDGEPELLLTIGVDVENDDGDGDDEDDYGDKEDNDEEARTVENGRVTAAVADDQKPHHRESDVDVNENRTAAVAEVVPQFKGIQQRREEWEKLLQQQRN